MKSRLILLIALLATICASTASAQGMAVAQQSVSPEEPRIISLQLTSTPVLQALDTLLKGTTRNYRLTPGTRVDGVVSVRLQDVPLDDAVKLVLRNAGLQAVRENQTYVIAPIAMVPGVMVPMQQAAPSSAAPIGTVDVKPAGARTGGRTFDILLDKANVLEAMRQILEVAGENYVIDTGLDSAWAGPLGPRISARMRGIALDEALQALATSASLVSTKVGSTYTVRPPDGAIPFSYTGGNGKGSGGKPVPGTSAKTALPTCAKCSRSLEPIWLFCPQCGTRAATPAMAVPTAK